MNFVTVTVKVVQQSLRVHNSAGSGDGDDNSQSRAGSYIQPFWDCNTWQTAPSSRIGLSKDSSFAKCPDVGIGQAARLCPRGGAVCYGGLRYEISRQSPSCA